MYSIIGGLIRVRIYFDVVIRKQKLATFKMLFVQNSNHFCTGLGGIILNSLFLNNKKADLIPRLV